MGIHFKEIAAFPAREFASRRVGDVGGKFGLIHPVREYELLLAHFHH